MDRELAKAIRGTTYYAFRRLNRAGSLLKSAIKEALKGPEKWHCVCDKKRAKRGLPLEAGICPVCHKFKRLEELIGGNG